MNNLSPEQESARRIIEVRRYEVHEALAVITAAVGRDVPTTTPTTPDVMFEQSINALQYPTVADIEKAVNNPTLEGAQQAVAAAFTERKPLIGQQTAREDYRMPA